MAPGVGGHDEDPREQLLAKLRLGDPVQAIVFAYEAGVVVRGDSLRAEVGTPPGD